MSLSDVNSGLMSEVRTFANSEFFAEAKKQHPALAAHDTPEAVVTVLCASPVEEDEEDQAAKEKEALLQVILQEHQREPMALWSSMLLAAGLPMLRKLRGRLPKSILPDDDLSQQVIFSFLEVVTEISPVADGHLFVRLRQATARKVFASLRREERRQQFCTGVELDDLAEMPTAETLVLADLDLDCADRVKEVVRAAVRLLPTEDIAMIVATTVRGEQLRSYVARTNEGAPPATVERIYKRLWRRRMRLLQELRSQLAPACAPDDPIVLLGRAWSDTTRSDVPAAACA